LPILLMTSLFAVFLALILSFIILKIPYISDAIIGVVWAVGMSIGIIFSELTPGYNAGLISYLFGSILTISNEDIKMMIGVDIFLILFILILYNQILLISYDKEFAKVRGLNVTFLYTLFLILISLTIVMSVRAIGLILIIAMFTIPPFIAEKFTKTLKGMMFLSGILSVIFMISGIFISFYLNISATATIILVATLFFFLSLLKK
jgi:zinc transport system permease protein